MLQPSIAASRQAQQEWVTAIACGEQHELRDGTYTLDDLLDIVELIRARRENEERAADAVSVRA